jgi:hypothetical protein
MPRVLFFMPAFSLADPPLFRRLKQHHLFKPGNARAKQKLPDMADWD